MAYLKDRTPELQDEVKNKNNDTAGTVIAAYIDPLTKILFLDVRVGERVYWHTMAANWEVTRACDELEGLG